MPTDYIYDIESYPNIFLCTVKMAGAPHWWTWEDACAHRL